MNRIALKAILIIAMVCIALLTGCQAEVKVELQGGNIVVSNLTDDESFTGWIKAGSETIYTGTIPAGEHRVRYHGSNGTITIEFKSDTDSNKIITDEDYLSSASVVYFRLK